MHKQYTHPIELLAPARDQQVAIEAIKHGADAVYMGAPMFGARAAATNSVDDLARVCDFAHQFDAKVYSTVNTLVYDHELKQAEQMIWQLWHAGVDALIVQDMGILRLDLPPIALHASTQCDLRTPDKARFLEAMGFSQLVMARELTLTEIADLRRAVKVPLEAFVHGALCVCYSGRCQMSQAVKGRSANRGECAQMCRLPYDLIDEQGRVLVPGKHLLSLRDMNRANHLQQMLEAGVSSFKIEGRLKDVNYVKNVVAYYRQALDRIIDQSDGRFSRSSFGSSDIAFEPDVRRSFNRSFTSYFIDNRRPDSGTQMASIHTPKSLGQPVGRVVRARGNEVVLDTKLTLANGDGLSYLAPDGQFTGMRVNVAQGNRVILRERTNVGRGATVWRTYDKAMDDILSHPTATRRIAVNAVLRRVGQRLVLTLSDERGCRVTHAISDADLQPAKAPQHDRQRDTLAKLGDTIYTLSHAQTLPDTFIPASVLTRLRRETIDLLSRTWAMSRKRDRRRQEDMAAPCFATTLTSADNVANHLAARLYRDHGVTHIEPALECQMASQSNSPDWADDNASSQQRQVMHTRYCLRRELGACLQSKDAKKLPARLFLRTGNTLFSVHCDCPHCEMHLTPVLPSTR